MKIKCGECGCVDETYMDSPCHVLKLCNACWKKQRKKLLEQKINNCPNPNCNGKIVATDSDGHLCDTCKSIWKW